MSIPQNKELVTISSSRDLQKISPNCSQIHFRKFISKNTISELLKKCPNLESVSISKSAYSRCGVSCINILEKNRIKIIVSEKRGRPNLLELRGIEAGRSASICSW